MRAYPRRFLEVFWWAQALLAVSGLLLLPGMLALRLEWDVPDGIAMLGSRVALAATHALLAFVGLLVLGALLPIHVRHGLRQHKNKRSGISLLSIFGVLILTGWGIYYLADERWNRWASVLHVLASLVVAIALTVHVIMAKKVQSEMRARHHMH